MRRSIADISLQQPGDPATLAITKQTARFALATGNTQPETHQLLPRPPEESIKGNIISVLGSVFKSAGITWLSSIKALKTVWPVMNWTSIKW
jgi:hypothetical protein